MKSKPYIYRIYDLGGTVYIGKGTGSRLAAQKRRFNLCGEIMFYCKDEIEAYKKERDLIAKYKPIYNKHPGGNGGWCGKVKWMREMESLGPTKYAARELLKFGFDSLSKYLTGKQIEKIWQVSEYASG